MKAATAAIALILSASTAGAEEPGDCAAVPDDAKRLICYDLIFKIKQTTAIESRWEVTEETSRIDDRKNVFLNLDSVEPLRGRFGQKERARLVLACREGKTSSYILFGGHFMSSLTGGAVTYRIDKRPAAKRRMTESSDHQALGLWSAVDAVPFVRELFGANSLYVQATPHGESPVSAEFQVAGLELAIKPLQSACKWPSLAQRQAAPAPVGPRP